MNVPDSTRQGYGQSFSGVDMNNQIGGVRVKHDFRSNWHLVVGALNQIANRNINSAVNQFVNNNASGSAQGYLAIPGSCVAPATGIPSFTKTHA